MTDQHLLNFALSFHGAMLLGGLAAYYKYGDRTALFDRSLRGTESALSEVRRRIATGLGQRLKPVFDNPESVIEMAIVDLSGNPIEVAVSPAGSEEYANAISEFISSDFEALIDCRRLLDLRRRWCGCARALSWAIFTFIVFEGLIAAGLAFLGGIPGSGGLRVLTWRVFSSDGTFRRGRIARPDSFTSALS